jgi:hypothetical protein
VQYGLSGTFAYLLFTDAAHRPTPIDLFGLKFDLPLWITAAPLVYGLINFHMCRVIRQMTRMLRKDKQNAASMAIMAVQSVWFGNPFHNAARRKSLLIASPVYIILCGVVPFIFFTSQVVNEVYLQVVHDVVNNISATICNFAFAASIFILMEVLSDCKFRIRRVLIRSMSGERTVR